MSDPLDVTTDPRYVEAEAAPDAGPARVDEGTPRPLGRCGSEGRLVTPYYADDWLTVYQGDCREVMASMEPESVHCVVTSPPYWGLRDYGTATWVGGAPDCDHLNGALASAKSTLAGYTSENIKLRTNGMPYRDTCGKCGAIRQDGQLGLEPTPEAYVENMVAVFREVRRVLRADGTVWLNLGDSYAGGGQTGRNDGGRPEKGRGWAEYDIQRTKHERRDGLKPKDLVGIPWRVAFALQADGWYLRSDIIWAKPNQMPESVTDRPTKSHEYVFLLTKSARYYFDADAVREPHIEAHLGRYKHDFWPDGTKESIGAGRPDAAHNTGGAKEPNPLGRNIRSVWTIATQPYPGAHFATFPRALVEPCIKAGTSEKGVCPECGAPWERVIDRQGGPPSGDHRKREGFGGGKTAHETGTVAGSALSNVYREFGYATNVTTGWRPSCRCEHDGGAWVPVPATVLDPFAGSGTTGMVAQSLSRRAVLIDLNGEYLTQTMGRNRDIPLGLGA